VAGWIGKNWAERQLQVLIGAQNEKLEAISSELKSEHDRRALVFKTHFDLEFMNNVELWNACDEAYDQASMLNTIYQSQPKDFNDTQEIRENALRMYETCRKALISVRKRRPFIDQAICDDAVSLVTDCVKETSTYHQMLDYMYKPHSGFDQTSAGKEAAITLERVKEKYELVAKEISARIKRMYVDPRYE
jgi:hypothetical protein